MLKLLKAVPICVIFLSSSCNNELDQGTKFIKLNTELSTQKKAIFEAFDNDPFNTKIYTLSNGLKIFMTVNHEKPVVYTEIAINVGSKQDPKTTTGLAHYLEHMMFKGTSKLGSRNWEEESKMIKQISDLYEAHRKTKDEDAKAEIYKKIDLLSYEASKHAIPGEYETLMTSLGAQKTNAHTSLEETVYRNQIPSNELDKWMTVEAERFQELVLRLFHTELEAVYEEYNIGLSRDENASFHLMMEKLFQKHSYGTQTTIGKAEHLKNPSMEKIQEQFKEYYVANNMAIILSGDFDPEEVVKKAEELFCKLPHKPVKTFDFNEERSQRHSRYGEVYSSNPEYVNIAFRLPGASEVEKTWKLELLDLILCNGSIGLIDKNINGKNKLALAYSSPEILKDYSLLFLHGKPIETQNLTFAKDLLLNQLELIKKGEFDESILASVINYLKLQDKNKFLSNENRVFQLRNSFILGISWKKNLEKFDYLSKLTKQDIVDFAIEHFQNNYAVIYKRIGDKKNKTFKKPNITPIVVKKDRHTDFFKSIISRPSKSSEIQILDFKKEIKTINLNSSVKINRVQGQTPGLFKLDYIFNVNQLNNPKLAHALQLLELISSQKFSKEVKNRRLFDLGLEIKKTIGDKKIILSLEGLESSIEEGLQILEDLLTNPEIKEEELKYYNELFISNRKVSTYSKGSLFNALTNYVLYGKDSPCNFLIPLDEMENLSTEAVSSEIKSLRHYSHSILYTGNKSVEELKQIIEKTSLSEDTKLQAGAKKTFTEQEIPENALFFVDYNIPQAEIVLLSRLDEYKEEDLVERLAMQNLYSSYFGSGLSSVMFQEIRESKALAYSTYSNYNITTTEKKHDYLKAYVGTQIDKLPEALLALKELVYNIPENEFQFESSRKSCLKNIENNRVSGSKIYWEYKKYKGNVETKKNVYERIKTISMTEFSAYFKKTLSDKNYSFLVLGNKKMANFDTLNKIAKVTEMKTQDLFGDQYIHDVEN